MKIQIVFYSMYGHIHLMAEAIAEGASRVDGAEVSLWRVPELVPEDKLNGTGAKAAQESFSGVPIIKPQQLATLVIHREDGSSQDVQVLLRIDTPIEVDYYKHGGILPFVLRQLLAT